MIFLEHHAIGELTQITRAITCPEFRYRWGICDSKKNESPTFKTRVSPRTVNSICPSRTKPISSPLCLSSPPFQAPGAITCTFAFRIRPREKGIKHSSVSPPFSPSCRCINGRSSGGSPAGLPNSGSSASARGIPAEFARIEPEKPWKRSPDRRNHRHLTRL